MWGCVLTDAVSETVLIVIIQLVLFVLAIEDAAVGDSFRYYIVELYLKR